MRRYDPDKLVRDVGRRVAEVRRERGLTQQQLATKLRATMQWVQQIEYGSNLTLFSLARLANTLGVPLETFLLSPHASSYVMRPGRPPGRAAAAPGTLEDAKPPNPIAKLPKRRAPR